MIDFSYPKLRKLRKPQKMTKQFLSLMVVAQLIRLRVPYSCQKYFLIINDSENFLACDFIGIPGTLKNPFVPDLNRTISGGENTYSSILMRNLYIFLVEANVGQMEPPLV
jgi:hypothetical protein